jgi:hypothetical protein
VVKHYQTVPRNKAGLIATREEMLDPVVRTYEFEETDASRHTMATTPEEAVKRTLTDLDDIRKDLIDTHMRQLAELDGMVAAVVMLGERVRTGDPTAIDLEVAPEEPKPEEPPSAG